MTRIETNIYDALANDAATLEQIATLYSDASRASWSVYRRIDFNKLDAAIKKRRGADGLKYVVIESNRKRNENN